MMLKLIAEPLSDGIPFDGLREISVPVDDNISRDDLIEAAGLAVAQAIDELRKRSFNISDPAYNFSITVTIRRD